MTGVYIDVTERRKAEDHKSLLIAELDHRVKNVLACVAAVAQHSQSADEFIDVLARAGYERSQVWCPIECAWTGVGALAKVGEGTLKWQAGARVAWPTGGSTQRHWLRHQHDLRPHPL
jgi:hypothetical protein